MASHSGSSLNTLIEAVEAIQNGQLSYHAAQAKYNIPKSTLHEYVTGKSKIGCRPGPAIVVMPQEEKLVIWAVEMAFQAAKIFPVSKSRARSFQIAPSKVYIIPSDTRPECDSNTAALSALESQMESTTLHCFQTRLEEGYDITDDCLYNTWL